jgi:uncharacterized membrane protein YkoI
MRFPSLMPVLTAAIASVSGLNAIHGSDFEEAFRLREGEEILPLEELLHHLGLGPDVRILEIENEFEHGRRVYEIEYLDRGGRIREVLIDADTGEVLADGVD